MSSDYYLKVGLKNGRFEGFISAKNIGNDLKSRKKAIKEIDIKAEKLGYAAFGKLIPNKMNREPR